MKENDINKNELIDWSGFSSESKSFKKIETKEEKYDQALMLKKEGRIKEAKKNLLKILDEYPEHKNSIKMLAEIYMDKSQSERAIRVLVDFLQKNPMDDEFLNLIGTYLDKIEELVLAKSFFKKSLSLCPGNEIVANNLNILEKKIKIGKEKRIAPRYLYLQKIVQKKDPKHTIALCMIIKNEEKNLAECLESVRDVVDEIIIVDTGSTDKSIEIAKKYGAEVRHFKWNHDFSDARNASLKDVKSDWILILDADETLEDSGKHFFRQLPDDNMPRVYLAKNLNILSKDHESNHVEHYNRRFFKNHLGIHYIGNIHEQLVCKDKDKLVQNLSDILIKHKGYQKEIIKDKNKNERNIKILKETIKNEPDNAFNYYNLGVQYYSMDDFENAIVNFQQSIKIHKGLQSSYLPFCYSSISEAYFKLKRYSDSINAALKAIEMTPGFSNAYFSLAHAYSSMEKYEEAIDSFKKAMEPKKDIFLGGTTDHAIFNWKSYLGIGHCHMQLGDYLEALKYFKKAYVFEKKSPALIMNLINAYNKLKSFHEIEKLFKRNKEIILNIFQIQQVTNILISAKKQDAALSFLQEMRKKYQTKGIVYDEEGNHCSLLSRGITDIYFEIKDYQNGIKWFEDYLCSLDRELVNKNKRAHIDALKKYGLCLFYLNDKHKAMDILKNALDMDRMLKDQDWELYFSYGILKMDAGEYEEAIPYFYEAIELNEQSCQSYIALAQIYLKMKKYNLTEDICSKAINLNMHQKDTQILYLKSKACSLQSKYEQAIDILVFLIESGKESAEAFNELGLCLSSLKEPDQSVDFFLKAIEKDNKVAQYYVNLGNALLEIKKYEDAKTAYTCALEIEPNHDAALIGLNILEVGSKLHQL